jgi:hypothetical protein
MYRYKIISVIYALEFEEIGRFEALELKNCNSAPIRVFRKYVLTVSFSRRGLCIMIVSGSWLWMGAW